MGYGAPYKGSKQKIAEWVISYLPEAETYCDIPYKDTDEYNTGAFDYDRFYDWACSQTQPIYISEYDMPEDRFEIVAEKEKRCTLSASNNARKTIERIYRPKQ